MDEGVYCSTAGTYFNERDSLQEHYQSEFHRYNLKRKIAGLPPVTKEWYEARRAQLAATTVGALHRVWLDPLTKKKFYSENTYLVFTRSKKYQDLVRRSGKPAPAAVVTVRRVNEAAAEQPLPPAPIAPAAAIAATASKTGFTVKPAVHGGPMDTSGGTTTTTTTAKTAAESDDEYEEEEEENDDEENAADAHSGSDWETVSEEEMDGSTNEWQEWDVCRCLFDNHMSATMEENLEYMWRNFGFYLPDTECLEDPEGLLQYLGAKLQYGNIPLYESGINPTAKQMASLHGAQRHMIDVGKCKVLYDGNEEEYEEFYNYEKLEDGGEDGGGGTLARVDTVEAAEATGGYELALATGRGGVKMLGSREFARYYKQRHKGGDHRESTVASRVVAQYKKLSVPLLGDSAEGIEEKKRMHRSMQKAERVRLGVSMRRNLNDNLPKNVPY